MDGIVLRDTCISSTLLNTSIWNKMRTFSFWKSGICSKYSFRKLTQFSQGINDLVPPACNTRGCLGEINVLFHLIWIGLLRAQWSYLHHEIPLLKEVFLEKLSQFPQGNNALDLPASNTDGCLWTDTCVSLTQLNRPIWYKMSLCPPWKLWFAEAFLSKTNSAHRETILGDAPASNTDDFLWRDTCFSSTHLNMHIWDRESLSPPGKTSAAGSFPFKTNSTLTGKLCAGCCSL
jgi:hypothetical protein